ncbi:MAG: HEAT repeat domain-containing protein [bacterium]
MALLKRVAQRKPWIDDQDRTGKEWPQHIATQSDMASTRRRPSFVQKNAPEVAGRIATAILAILIALFAASCGNWERNNTAPVPVGESPAHDLKPGNIPKNEGIAWGDPVNGIRAGILAPSVWPHEVPTHARMDDVIRCFCSTEISFYIQNVSADLPDGCDGSVRILKRILSLSGCEEKDELNFCGGDSYPVSKKGYLESGLLDGDAHKIGSVEPNTLEYAVKSLKKWKHGTSEIPVSGSVCITMILVSIKGSVLGESIPLIISTGIATSRVNVVDERVVVENKILELENSPIESMRVLVDALEDRNDDVRIFAIEAVAKLGDRSRILSPYIIHSLLYVSDGVRKKAAESLMAIFPKFSQVVSEFEQNYRQIEWEKKKENVSALRRSVASELAYLFHFHSGDERCALIEAMDELGEESEPATAVLIEALGEDNVVLRRYAARVLGNIRERAPTTVPHLIQALKDDDTGVRREAIQSLGKLGPLAETSIPFLIDLRKDPDGEIRYKVISSLSRIGPKTGNLLSYLEEALYDDKLDVQNTAATLLSEYGEGSIPALILALKSKDKTVRWLAARSLGNLGRIAIAALPALRDALQDEDGQVRSTANEAIEDISKKIGEMLDGVKKE